jgi:hypothetical protein
MPDRNPTGYVYYFNEQKKVLYKFVADLVHFGAFIRNLDKARGPGS